MNKRDDIRILKMRLHTLRFCMVSGREGLGKLLRVPLQMVLQIATVYHLVG